MGTIRRYFSENFTGRVLSAGEIVAAANGEKKFSARQCWNQDDRAASLRGCPSRVGLSDCGTLVTARTFEILNPHQSRIPDNEEEGCTNN